MLPRLGGTAPATPETPPPVVHCLLARPRAGRLVLAGSSVHAELMKGEGEHVSGGTTTEQAASRTTRRRWSRLISLIEATGLLALVLGGTVWTFALGDVGIAVTFIGLGWALIALGGSFLARWAWGLPRSEPRLVDAGDRP